jgi:asparagine synthase (glutamine-hydrolysing)
VRLAILDLSEKGHQPMFYNHKLGASSEKFNPQNIKHSNICIVFNGEIYNYKEIRQELQSQ